MFDQTKTRNFEPKPFPFQVFLGFPPMLHFYFPQQKKKLQPQMHTINKSLHNLNAQKKHRQQKRTQVEHMKKVV